MHDVRLIELRFGVPRIKPQDAHPQRLKMFHVLEQLHFAPAGAVEGHGVGVEEDGQRFHKNPFIRPLFDENKYI